MTTVKLRNLVSCTVFRYENKTLRSNGIFQNGKAACEPYLGGQWQTHEDFCCWIPLDAEVEVE